MGSYYEPGTVTGEGTKSIKAKAFDQLQQQQRDSYVANQALQMGHEQGYQQGATDAYVQAHDRGYYKGLAAAQAGQLNNVLGVQGGYDPNAVYNDNLQPHVNQRAPLDLAVAQAADRLMQQGVKVDGIGY